VSASPVIVALGELLWDLLPAGPQLGGAPANFACHARALGADACLVSRVGDDSLGRGAVKALAALGLPTGTVAVDTASPTGTVDVLVEPDGQPRYQIHENVAWDGLVADSAAQEVASRADAICFGTLAQRSERSRSAIQSLLQIAPQSALRIFDVNLRQHYYTDTLVKESLERSNVIKVNDAELPKLAGMFHLTGDPRAQIRELAGRFNLRLVAYTRGPLGSLLYSGGAWSDLPGRKVTVVDTVGAGDAFTAALTVGLLAGRSLDLVHQGASEVAAFVCSRAGATPPLPDDLRARFGSA